MNGISSVALKDVKVVANWFMAPVGTLLQATEVSGDTVIGMRCETEFSGIPRTPCLLVLDGEKRGKILESGAIRDGALDVSKLVEIRVANPRIAPYGQEYHDVFGIVCETVAGSGCLLARGSLRSGIRAYVMLVDPDKKDEPGTVFMDVPPQMTVVGELSTAVLDEFVKRQ